MPLPPLTDNEILGADIVAELGLDALPEEQRVRIVSKLSDLVQQRVMLHIAEKLSEADAIELQKLMTKKGESDPEVAAFVMKKIPDMPEVLKNEIIKVKRELLEHMNTSGS